MTEVSCRAFSYFQEAERAGVLDVDALLEGLSVPRRVLEDPSNRVPWDFWAELCDRAEAVLGEEALRESIRFGINPTLAGYLHRVAPIFVDQRSLYRVAFGWAGAGLYRSVDFSVTEPTRDSLILDFRLRPGFRPSHGWFVLMTGGAGRVPGFVGLPANPIEILRLDGTSARVRVLLPERRGASWLRRLAAGIAAPAAIERELLSQQQQLTEAWADMRGATASFKNVLEGLPAGVLVVASGRVVYANPDAERLAGASTGALQGRLASELFTAPAKETVEGLLDGTVVETSSLETLRPDGEPGAFVSVRAVRGVEFQGQPADVLVSLDVTAERLARMNLERSEATMRALAETQEDLLIRFDDDLRVLDVKPGRGQESSRLTACIGLKIEDVMKSLPAAEVGEAPRNIPDYREAMRAGAVFERNIVVRQPDGQPRYLVIRGTPILEGRESILTVRDDTARRLVEQRLAIAERMGALGTLMAGIGHEVNNPLTWVVTNLDLIKEAVSRLPSDSKEPLSGLVDSVLLGTDRIRDIVGRIRETSHIEPRERVRVSIQQAIENALAITEHQWRTQVALVRELEPVPDVLGDPTELGQVFINLIVNAIHAMADGPATGARPRTLTIRLFSRDVSARDVSARDVSAWGGRVMAEVEDTGAGMEPEVLARIFDPFFTTKDRKTGTGLGLSIVHGFVTAAGGTIEVTSRVGHGTKFQLSFPALSPLPEVAPSPVMAATATKDPAIRGHVIVIDDERLVGMAISRVLAKHDVAFFTDPREALEALITAPHVDLILCDMSMPGMSGIDVHAQIERTRPELLPRLVFLTGGAFTPETQGFLKRADIRTLQKPVPTSILRELAEDFTRTGLKARR